MHTAGSIEYSHTHPCYELVYYVRGEGITTIGDQSFRYKPNTYAIIHENTPHSEVHSTKTEVLFFAFDLNMLSMKIDESLYEDENNVVLNCVKKVWWEFRKRKPLFKYFCDMYIYAALLEHLRLYNKVTDDGNDIMIASATEFIHNNITKNIKIKDIAKSINYSCDYLRHKFLSATGMGIKEYIIKEKIIQIKNALDNSNDSIEEISRNFAFKTQANFSSFFKKYVGASPLEYRNKKKEESHKIIVKYK